MRLKELNSVYFLGIGGVGMSAIARYFNSLGIKVAGYDLRETTLTKQLVEEGVSVNYEDDVNNVPSDADLIVFTPAIPKDNEQFKYCCSTAVPMKKRAEVLGLISRDTITIGVAGTHGKTSISSLIAHILHQSDVGCTAFIGGIVNNYASNYIAGNPEIVVVEADEYDRSFLHLNPDVAVVSNVDADHLDIYGDLSTMVSTFQEYAGKLGSEGKLVVNQKVSDVFSGSYEKLEYTGVEGGLTSMKKTYVDLSVSPPRIKMDAKILGVDYVGLTLPGPGVYNVENALAACAVVKLNGVSDDQMKSGLDSFKGVKRRFEYYLDGSENGKVYIDDYAHHPEELKQSITAVKSLYPEKKLTVVFQPHLFSRTNDFYQEFGKSLSLADEVILLDIYPARELPMEGVTSKLIFDEIKGVEKCESNLDEVVELVQSKSPELIMTLGAGDIDKKLQEIKAVLQ